MDNSLWRDFVHAARTLLRSPSFSLVAVLALALGISGNTVIFSAFNAVVLRSLPYEDAGELVMVWESDPGQAATDSVVPANFFAWRADGGSFEQMAGFFPFVRLTLLGGERPEEVMAASVTGNFFATLGTAPALGRTFATSAGGAGGARGEEDLGTVVLSDALWSRLFTRDPQVVGQTLSLDGRPYNVIGVMPAEFKLPENVDLWVRAPGDLPDLPVVQDPQERMQIGYMRVLGRLRSGVSLAQARDELATIQRDRDPDRSVNLVPLQEQILGDIRPILWLLMGAVGLVLLIACGNVANLLLARAAGRGSEVAVRVALGAGRMRVVRQLLAESVLLALAAGALGLLLAQWELELLLRFLPPDVPRAEAIALDGSVLVFTVVLSVLTGVLFGLLPALQVSKPDLVRSLKDGAKSTAGVERRRAQSSLLVWEVAMTLVLLIGTSLLLQSFLRLQRVDPGFDSRNLMTLKVNLPGARYSDPVQMRQFFERLTARLATLPGVAATAASLDLPFTANEMKSTFLIDGKPAPAADEERAEGIEAVSPGYFRALGIPLRQGREFTPQDAAGAPDVAVISESIAESYWPGEDPVGQRITYDDPSDPEARWLTVVGVVGDVRSAGPQRPVRPLVYRPYLQQPWPFMNVTLRTGTDPESLMPEVRRAVAEIDPEQPIAELKTVDEVFTAASARPRFTLLLVGAFAVIATVLAALGIYGVIAYSVAQRRHEIGLRMALGAERREILGQVIRRGLRLTLFGVLLGLAGALALNQVMRSLLFGINPTDILTYLGVSAFFVLVSLLANLVPAYRASRLEPIIALRSD
jgi:predicted permease